MMVFKEPIPIDPQSEDAEFQYYSQLRELIFQATLLSLTLKGGTITHGDKAGNLNAQWIVFTSNAVANTEDAVTHTLGRAPIGVLAAIPDKAATLYDSGTAPTSTTIYLKSSAATVAWKAIIF